VIARDPLREDRALVMRGALDFAQNSDAIPLGLKSDLGTGGRSTLPSRSAAIIVRVDGRGTNKLLKFAQHSSRSEAGGPGWSAGASMRRIVRS